MLRDVRGCFIRAVRAREMWTSGENCRLTLPPEIRRPFVVNNEFIFCHFICVFGLDVVGIARSEAIEGVKGVDGAQSKRNQARRNFGIILDGLLPK